MVVVVVNIDPFAEQAGVVRDPGLARLPACLRRARAADRQELHVARRPQLRQARAREGHVLKVRRTIGFTRPEVDTGGFARVAPRGAAGRGWFERDPVWFKTAVFYEIHLRGFYDGNDDGSGDFRGLADKLDYLQWLGVDCIWLLPFYPSPLRDGGYDIADFFTIHPDYGTVDDFKLTSSTRRTSAACA